MDGVLRLARIQILVIITFIINKALIRPYVLKHDFPNIFDIFVLSYSNFCEAIVGVLTLTYIGLYINQRMVRLEGRWREASIYIIAVVLAGVYVISQELKIHNLGGNNVYDPYDLLFSVIGLIAGYAILAVIKPVVTDEQ